MAQFVSAQARTIHGLGVGISAIIRANLDNILPQVIDDTLNGLVAVIGNIRASLLHNNVRVREHAHLGAAFPPPLKARKVLQSLSNIVHVLCVLVDAINGGQGAAPTQEETSAITDGHQALGATLTHLGNTISPTSSEADSE